jgi:hypothetical protein
MVLVPLSEEEEAGMVAHTIISGCRDRRLLKRQK